MEKKRLKLLTKKNIKSDKEIWFESKKSWSNARKHTNKVMKAKAKCPFIKYDQNGKICGVQFDE